MKKIIDWLECHICGDDSIEITTTSGDDSPLLCYEGDGAKCLSCNSKGSVYICDCENPPTAHIDWYWDGERDEEII